MIDDDAFLAAALWPDGGPGWFGCLFALIGLAVVITIAVIAAQNETECETKSCKAGTARLLDGECVCTTEPQ